MEELEQRAAELHSDAIVMDMTCPLMNSEKHWQWWIDGGVTVAAPTVNDGDNIRGTTQFLGYWLRRLRANPESLVHVKSVSDVYEAKKSGRLGILFHFQNTLPFERDLDMLGVYHELGVRVIQLAYNEKNHVGNGCEERADDGLSRFGIRAIQEMNALGIVVDCAHTGERTTLDALEASSLPVVVSHGNARRVCDNQRNLTDELIKAVASQGGLTGLVGFPAFVRRGVNQPTVGDLVDHCEHICELTGNADHVALGLDYYDGMAGVATNPEEAQRDYEARIQSGVWNEEDYPPPPHAYPKGIETPAGLRTLTSEFLDRGFSGEDTRKILGLNWLRVLAAHGM